MYSQYQDYLTKPHYRAFATAPSHGDDAVSTGYTWNHRTVEGAIEQALKGCKDGEKKQIQITPCELHSIGDINVAGMKKEQIDKAIALYTLNKFATNDELLKTVGQLPKKK
jgi:hypothetical protein